MCAQSCLTLGNPMDCSLPGSLVPGILQARYWSGLPCPLPGALPHPRTEPSSASPALQAGSLPNERPGRPQRPAYLLLNQRRAESLHCPCAPLPSESSWPAASRAVLWVAVWLLVPARLSVLLVTWCVVLDEWLTVPTGKWSNNSYLAELSICMPYNLSLSFLPGQFDLSTCTASIVYLCSHEDVTFWTSLFRRLLGSPFHVTPPFLVPCLPHQHFTKNWSWGTSCAGLIAVMWKTKERGTLGLQ